MSVLVEVYGKKARELSKWLMDKGIIEDEENAKLLAIFAVLCKYYGAGDALAGLILTRASLETVGLLVDILKSLGAKPVTRDPLVLCSYLWDLEKEWRQEEDFPLKR